MDKRKGRGVNWVPSCKTMNEQQTGAVWLQLATLYTRGHQGTGSDVIGLVLPGFRVWSQGIGY